MSDWVEVLRVPAARDLSELNAFLQAEGIPTWVFEENGQQCLCVPRQTDPLELERVLLLWEQGGIAPAQAQARSSFLAQSVLAQWRAFPLTMLLLVLAAICYVMAATPLGWMLGGARWLECLAMQPLKVGQEELVIGSDWPAWHQAWRFWTPALLHFSFLHLLFNAVMLLELGRRLEMAQGRRRWLVVVAVSAWAANVAQFIDSPGILFGGLSGVVYALVGYGWTYQRLSPGPMLVMPGLMWAALFWQVLCFSGLVSLAGLGQVANAAHVGGLVAGVLVGAACASLDRSGRALPPGMRA